MPDLAFTIGNKIFACFLHEKASKYDNHHYIQLFSMQKPGNLLQNLFCIAQHTCTLLTELEHLQQTLENDVQSTVCICMQCRKWFHIKHFIKIQFSNLKIQLTLQ